MSFRFLIFFSFIILINSKAIFPWNITTTIKKTSTIPTQTTPIETSTVLNISTTIKYEEKTTTATILTPTTIENNKIYEFRSNFSRNNDSVSVSLHSNASDIFVSINNTFIDNKQDNYPCEVLFNEYSINSNKFIKTKIFINFNGSFTRDLANQIGDRLIDIVDLLSTVRSMVHQNNTLETV